MLNNVSFGSSAGVFTKADLTKPQTFTRPAAPQEAPVAEKKKSKVGSFVKGLLITAAIATAALVAGNKTGFFKNVGKYIPDSVKNASFLQKAKEPVKTAFASLDKWGGAIVEKAAKGWEAVKSSSIVEKVKGFFSKGGGEVAGA